MTPKVGGFRSFTTARRVIAAFEATLWLRKGFDFAGRWTAPERNDPPGPRFGLQVANQA